ncbi:hypothetical protein [Caulobacter sp.]|uniref:hypothetical protein n=1 Tax=Caulobacter sp. TaxID=78 RepID=UPI001B1131B9|nr:hypothetical protein [Caulobacter sp.]MBO9546451.1 hypothetical protein [Caulobacter sp.]
MSVVVILLMTSLFVLAAMVGLADALVHFVCWSFGRLTEGKDAAEAPQAPVHGITA